CRWPQHYFLSPAEIANLIELVRQLAMLISCAEHSLQEIDKMKSLVLCLAVVLSPVLAFPQSYDLVIQGGRVIDPETGLDGVRNVGISQGSIKKISAEALAGKRMILAKGLVVAPGFIDLHQHDLNPESQRLKALDGVTTALEMEIGKPDVAAFLQSMQGHTLINYGSTASHPAARSLAFGTPVPQDSLLPKSGTAASE